MTAPHAILFTIPNFITAGSGRALLNLIERLDRTRFAPGVCVAHKGGDLDQEVEAMGIPFIEAPFTVSPKPYVTLLWRASSVSPCPAFALWHSFHYSDDYTEPIIAWMAGARAWVFTKKNMGWNSRAWALRSRFAARIAAQNGDMMREFFRTKGLRSKARLVPRGVDCLRFSPHAPATLQIRALRVRANTTSDRVAA
jgi:glycosyltransferase involved in cell wall biosynthesis